MAKWASVQMAKWISWSAYNPVLDRCVTRRSGVFHAYALFTIRKTKKDETGVQCFPHFPHYITSVLRMSM